jgi:hypothetical protein
MIRFSRKAVLLTLCLSALALTGVAQAQSVPKKPGPKADRYVADYRTMESAGWKKDFPNLGRYEVLATSTPKGKKKVIYNCIAHTVRIYDKWVWPGANVSDFDKLYGSIGYKRIQKLDYRFNTKLDKIVLYAKRGKNGNIECTHGARQLADGTWTSKLGQGPLIRHATPASVSGPSYGKPIAVYVKARKTPPILPSTPATRRPAVARTTAPKSPARTARTDDNIRRIKTDVPPAPLD